MKFRCFVWLVAALVLSSGVLAAANSITEIPIPLTPKVNNARMPNTDFAYQFVLSTNSACNGVLLNVSQTITTDSAGEGFYRLNVSNVSLVPSFLCEYRNGSLRTVHLLNPNQFNDHTNASELSSGTVPDARLSNNVAFLANLTPGNIAAGTFSNGNYTFTHNLSVNGLIRSGGVLVCLADGTNCPASSGDNGSWNQTGYWNNATGSFYPLLGNPSGYITDGNTGWDNSYSLIANGTNANLVNLNITGKLFVNWTNLTTDQILEGTRLYDNTSWNQTRYWNNASASFYPLTGNPSGFLTSYTETDSIALGQFQHYINSTQLNNATICRTDGTNCPASTANASWNQSHANTLYLGIGATAANSNQLGGQVPTYYLNTTGGTYDNQSWNETRANAVYYLRTDGVLDNQSWNQSKADGLYASISVTGGNASWNQTKADTLYAPITTVGDNQSWNQTKADGLYLGISGTAANSNQLGGQVSTYYLNSTGGTYDNTSWNQTKADGLYAPISVTGGNASWNESYANGLFYRVSNGSLDNRSWNQTKADGLYAPISTVSDNTSWNQTHANTLYAPISVVDTNSGFTQWQLQVGGQGARIITNNSLVRLLAGTGITISNDTNGNITITSTITDTNNGGTSNWSVIQSPNGSIMFAFNGTHINGTVNQSRFCLADGTNCQAGVAGNPFNQSLNTTERVRFHSVNSTMLRSNYTRLGDYASGVDEEDIRSVIYLDNEVNVTDPGEDFADHIGIEATVFNFGDGVTEQTASAIGAKFMVSSNDAADDAGNVMGVSVESTINSRASFNGQLQNLYGYYSVLEAYQSASGYVPFATGYLSEMHIYNATQAASFWATAPIIDHGTYYGILLENSAATPTSYAIYTNNGRVRFGDNVTVIGNVNATGSLYSNNKLVCLQDGTNCPASSGDNSSWNQSYANTLYAPLGSGNASWNQTHANTLYAPITTVSDNQSWNQSKADSLYLGIAGTAANSNQLGGQVPTYYLNSTGGTYDNTSWNQTKADALYAPIGVGGDNASWNQTHANTLYAPITTVSDNTSWNESRAKSLFIQNSSDALLNFVNATSALNVDGSITTMSGTNVNSGINVSGRSYFLYRSPDLFIGTTNSNTIDNRRLFFHTNTSAPSTSNSRLMIGQDGRIGVGTTQTTTILSVNGSINASGDVWANGFRLCQSDGTNCPASSANTSFNQTLTDSLYAPRPVTFYEYTTHQSNDAWMISPTTGSPSTFGATQIRCEVFTVPNNSIVRFDTVRTAFALTNLSVGFNHGIYNCTGNGTQCMAGAPLLYNFTTARPGGGWNITAQNLTANWTLPTGAYGYCMIFNSTVSQASLRLPGAIGVNDITQYFASTGASNIASVLPAISASTVALPVAYFKSSGT